MQRLHLVPKKRFGPLPFLAQLESDMRKAGCSNSSIAEFKKFFDNPDPQSLYAQNILADLQANRYAPKSVKRHITRMRDFQKKCFSAMFLYRTASEDWDLRLATRYKTFLYNKQLTRLYLSNKQLAALPGEIGQLANLKQLHLGSNRLATLPGEFGQLANLQDLNLNDNRLATLPDEIRQLANLRRLWLQNNQFTTVPRALLDLPATTEINLQGNRLPPAEIMAVREEMNQRRERGLPVPQLILPPLAADGDDALRVAAAGGMNVHLPPLTDAFKRLLDELADQVPFNREGSPAEQRAEMKIIERRLFTALECYAAKHPDYDVALYVARLMFETGYGQRRAHFNDFSYSPGHVLSYVFLAVEAQCNRTPKAQRKQAEENGANILIARLAACKDPDGGGFFCDTRKIEEVLQIIGIPLSQYALDNPDIIGTVPGRFSAEVIRDKTLPVAKRILLDIAQQNPGLADDALREAFRTALTSAMHAEHPLVTQEQINAYLDTDILPVWDTFKELALES